MRTNDVLEILCLLYCLIDFRENPPEEDRYGSIKKRLLSTFDLFRTRTCPQLLSLPDLGDRKPTAWMNDMLALLVTNQPCFLFNHIFLQRLPEDMKVALVFKDRLRCTRTICRWFMATIDVFISFLPKVEVKYSAFDSELLAIHFAVRDFCCFLDS